MQAITVPIIYVDGYQTACLQSQSSNWCLVESQEWQGSDVIRYSASNDLPRGTLADLPPAMILSCVKMPILATTLRYATMHRSLYLTELPTW